MTVLSQQEIEQLLEPYLGSGWALNHQKLVHQLSVYLDLLVKWNGHMNLTSVRDPHVIVRRHFGESLFLARHLAGGGTLLDLGSGAGFPGVPIQLWHGELRVTLAESQGRKAAFLREVIRILELPTEVWGGRAEDLAPDRKFDVVVLRAVDDPERALSAALRLAEGSVWVLTSDASLPPLPKGISLQQRITLPGSEGSCLFQLFRGAFHVEH